MAEALMTALRLLLSCMLMAALPALAFAQDATDQAQPAQDDDQTQPQPDGASAAAADPIEALQGLWHVDHAEGSAASEAMTGSILKVDRQAIASLAGGTCSSPGFTPTPDATDPKQAGVDITCLGQVLASARWNTDDPDTVDWSEPGLEVVLHRVTSAAAPQPATDDGSGDGDAQ
jgi:hypothetical protein